MSTAFLLQSTASSVIVFLQDRYLGTGKEGLVASDVTCQLKKATDSLFSVKTLVATTNATASIGSGANGTVTISVPGTVGNTYTVSVVSPGGTTPLSVTIDNTVITVSLSVNTGTPVAMDNTATLVAAAITNASDLVTAAASGTGADSLTIAEGPDSFVGGLDGDMVELGGGYYKIALSAANTSVLGNLYVRLDGPSIVGLVDVATVSAVTPATPVILPVVATTVITGTVFDPAGEPQADAVVQARILSIPSIFDGVAITTALTVVRTDESGYFTITLITGARVDISIPSASYRRTIIVPASSTSLFDIP